MLADVNASPTCAQSPRTAHGVGFVSPLFYAIASNPSRYAASFHDITVGNNDLYDLRNGRVFPATRGYDLATGLGSPKLTSADGARGLAYYLCTAAGAGSGVRPTVRRLSPVSGPLKAGTAVKISGSGFKSGDRDEVAGVQVGTFPLPAKSIKVTGPRTIRLRMPAARKTLPHDSPKPQNGAGPVNIVITLRDHESSATTAVSRFEYVDRHAGTLASISAVSPRAAGAAILTGS